MANRQYTVASTAQLVGTRAEDRYLDDIKAMDHADREKSQLKRSMEVKRGANVPPAPLRTDNIQEVEITGTDIFTHSRHAFWSSSSPTTAIPESLPEEEPQEETLLLLKPVAYTPSGGEHETDSVRSSSSSDSQTSVKERVKDFEAQICPQGPPHVTSKIAKGPTVDAEASIHIRSPSESSTSSKRRRRRSQGLEIYFTPTDYTKSKIFLSSPQSSPTLPKGDANEAPNGGEDDATTPRASAGTSRPPSEIYVGSRRFGTPATITRKEKLRITPEQLDQLVDALAKARMVQKDVRKHWWDFEDIPEDDTMSAFSGASIPTLTSASTLYSQPNATSAMYSTPNFNFLAEHRSSKERKEVLEVEFARNFPNHPNAKRPATPIDALFGGISLTDTKIHGSPIRFVSKNYRVGANVLAAGSCSFVQVPYGVDVECTLRVEPRSSYSTSCRVMFQCVNQVVDRKTGKRTSLLVADEDVTEDLTKAALAELSMATNRDVPDIDVAASPTALSPFQSPDIDWAAVADELQATAETAALVETTISLFNELTKETCHMQTNTLLSTLERIKDQHSDFLILRPTAFHENGIPRSMHLPWVSQRLYHDWYETEGSVGHSSAAKDFQEQIVAAVAKHALEAEKFTTHVKWEDERLVVQCVPLSEGAQGRCDVWACFVRGMFDI